MADVIGAMFRSKRIFIEMVSVTLNLTLTILTIIASEEQTLRTKRRHAEFNAKTEGNLSLGHRRGGR